MTDSEFDGLEAEYVEDLRTFASCIIHRIKLSNTHI